MNILVNNTATVVHEKNLLTILTELGYENLTIATAINGEFVPVSVREKVFLCEGDKLEILAPMQGG
ncbi:sulfur carrier protein ThiS [Marinomonas agarivorans]|nr:sulfur carrier protein ThiS [Marinomonas agarivorans]